MTRNSFHGTFNHRQLRVGELIKQNLGQIFLKNEAKIPSLNTKLVTITEVKMSSDLKSARAYNSTRRERNRKNSKYLDRIFLSC